MDFADEGVRKMAREAIRLARNALLMDYRFLDRALYQLTLQEREDISFGSNGKVLYYNPLTLLKRFRSFPEILEWQMLHTLFHCLYMHPFLHEGKDPYLWNVACDVYVTDILLMFRKSEKVSAQTFFPAEAQEWVKGIKDEVTYFSASGVYNYLQNLINSGKATKEEVIRKGGMLDLDIHPWYTLEIEVKVGRLVPGKAGQGQKDQGNGQGQDQKKDQNQDQGQGQGQGQQDQEDYLLSPSERQSAAQNWQDLARQVEVGISSAIAKGQGFAPGDFSSTLEHITRENESYADFLRRFATLEERMVVDMDEFDYIYYTLGLTLYQNTPLVEPLEYKEIPSIREFIIVLDTSGSCSDEMLRKFLTKTYDILSEEQLFGTTLHVRILQCDARIQSDVLLTSKDELEKYAQSVEVLGRGGTDFRPAFDYVEELFEKQEIERLDGLLYFTDGYGTYPTEPTSYPTAFIFTDVVTNLPVPPWAMRVFLEDMSDLEDPIS